MAGWFGIVGGSGARSRCWADVDAESRPPERDARWRRAGAPAVCRGWWKRRRRAGRRQGRDVTFKIRDGHPRMLVRPEELPGLRDRAANTHAEQMQSLRALASAGAEPGS